MIRYKTTGYPTSVSDGSLVVDKSNTPSSNDSYVHTNLTNGVLYYYSAFAHDGVPNYATKADTSATPVDITPPAQVSGLTATAADQQVTLTWTSPSDVDFTGAMIRYKTTGYPTSVSDGTLLVDKAGLPSSGDNYTQTGLTNGLTYYYRAFAHDAVPNYNTSSLTVSCTPSFNTLWLSEVFDPYANATLTGQGNWIADGSYPGADVQSALAQGGGARLR